MTVLTTAYMDTSAAMKLVVIEDGTAGMLALVTGGGRRFVSSWLLHTELHCAAGRHPDDVDRHQVQNVLKRVTLLDVTRGDLLDAGTHTPLRALDALHLAAALRVGADEMITYDAELADAAARAGLSVLAPA